MVDRDECVYLVEYYKKSLNTNNIMSLVRIQQDKACDMNELLDLFSSNFDKTDIIKSSVKLSDVRYRKCINELFRCKHLIFGLDINKYKKFYKISNDCYFDTIAIEYFKENEESKEITDIFISFLSNKNNEYCVLLNTREDYCLFDFFLRPFFIWTEEDFNNFISLRNVFNNNSTFYASVCLIQALIPMLV